jgi:spore coat protein JB
MSGLPEAYYTMLEELQRIDFVLVELTLYLDTHPLDEKALAQFNQLAHLRQKLKREFEANFGPLTQFSSPSASPWSWAEGPWPWEV